MTINNNKSVQIITNTSFHLWNVLPGPTWPAVETNSLENYSVEICTDSGSYCPGEFELIEWQNAELYLWRNSVSDYLSGDCRTSVGGPGIDELMSQQLKILESVRFCTHTLQDLDLHISIAYNDADH